MRWIRAGLALLGLTAALAPALAADERPLLVVEQGAHSAPVRRIDASPRRGLVVTASDDRTARVWDLASGELRHVLRPLAFGAEGGRLYGAAIHPVEPLVAVAGTTGGEGRQHLIYLFDLDSGALRRTIDARAGDIRKLVWSHDGTVLLAGYNGANGVRAFALDGRPLFEEPFAGPVFGLATASNGLAAAVSLDGRLRVYRAAAGVVAAVADTPLPGRRSAGVTFSPDGRQLAVAYADRGEAPEIFDAESARSVAKLPPVPLRGGDFRVIAWSSDGRSLYTGGTAQSQQMGYPIVQYDVASRRATGQADVARDSVTDLAVLPSGELAYSSFDGSWGVFTNGRVARSVTSQVSTVRGDTPEDLELSADALALRWGMQGRQGFGFQFDKRKFSPTPRQSLRVPETRFSALNAPSDWKFAGRPPVVGGKTLALAADERSRALAIARSNPAAAIIGTNRALYRLDEKGDVQWRMPVDTEIRAVNTSSDGRVVVSAMADGTVRWWRASDGRHLLTLMVFADGRWVIWTPSGYYDASTGADQVVGWALGASQQQAMNYYSLNRFRERFNRPDVIDAVLKTLDEAAAFTALAAQDEAARQAVQRDAQARAAAAQSAERESAEKSEQARLAAVREAEARAAAEREARDTLAKLEQARLATARETQARAAAERAAAERAAQEQAARAEQTRRAEARRVAAEAQAARETAAREAAQREAEARDTAAKLEQARLAAAREAQARAAAELAAAERAAQEQAERAEQARLAEARRLAAEAQVAREAAARDAAQREAEARAAQEREIASRNAALEAQRVVARLEAAREAAAKDLAAKDAAARAAAREAAEREAAAKARRALTELKASEFPPALLTFENKRLKAAAAEITLPFSVTSADRAGDVTVEVRVNGRPARPTDLVIPKALDGATRGFAKLPVGPGESIVEIIAHNNYGASEPLSFRVERDVVAPVAPRAAGPAGDLYVLSIGVSDYARADYKLGLAAKDASDFADAMRSQEGRLYRRVIVRTLTNKDATRVGITREFDALRNAVGPADVAMVFMAGHGLNDTTGQYFFLPYDGNHERLLSSAIPQSTIVSTLSRIRGKTLFFVDTCFAGNSLGALSRASRKTERMINDLSSSENGVVVFASSTGQEESEEKDEWGNGAFTKALIEGLAGRADFMRAGRVTFAGLNLFVSEEVTRLTEGRQRPVFISPRGIPDFALVRL
jgi:WD40 repeat protein